MNRSRLAVGWVCALALISAGVACAQMGPAVPKDKKLIGWACDRISTGELPKRVAALEKHIPFDGLVITVYPDAAREGDGRYARWFGGKRHSRDDFKQAIADLKATKFTRFTDNFIDFQTTVRGDPAPDEANLDWFDPNWSVIANNGAVAAHVAREGGLKGLFMDVEHYSGGLGPWLYPFDYKSYARLTEAASRTPHSLGECVTQVRKRGRQFMQTVTAVYPDITIVMIQDTGWESGPLVAAFVEGMLEARGRATFVDGAEQAYRMMTYQELMNLRRRAESAQSSELYKGMQYGFGLWWDFRTSADMASYSSKEGLAKNVRNPERLEHPLYNALTAADRYVWVYSYGAYRGSIWWSGSYDADADWALDFPQPYVEAFRNCRKPHDLAWIPSGKNPRVNFDGVVLVVGDKITGQQNLLANGDFEAWSNGPDKAPDGWSLVIGSTAGKSAHVMRDAASAKLGRYSPQLGMATLGDTGHISLDQAVAAEVIAAKTVTFGAWIKTNDPDLGNLEIVGVYHGNTSTVSPPDAQGWRFHTLTAPIPRETTGRILFRLLAFVQYSPE
jgi:hypothetical protein